MAMIADPWDAPYFGAPVYFTYQPTAQPAPSRAATTPSAVAPSSAVATPHAAELAAQPDNVAASAASAATRWDPWDAPYFGASVYLAYQPSPLPAQPTTVTQPAVQNATGAPPQLRESERESERPLVAAGVSTTTGSQAFDATSMWRQSWFGRLFGAGRRG